MRNILEMTHHKAFASLLLAAMLAGCDAGSGASPIGDIAKNPNSFEGREVKIHGTASQMLKLPFADTKSYQLKDASGEIVVWTTAAMPADGEELVVRGKIENIAIISGQSLGLSLKETERRPPGIRWPWQ